MIQFSHETDTDQSKDKANSNLDPIIVPKFSKWFSLDKIHEIEENTFPDLLNEGDGKTYLIYRNFMVNTWRANPDEYLSLTFCRRNLTGSLGVIMRIHSFLEKWKLINWKVEHLEYLQPHPINPIQYYPYIGTSPSSNVYVQTKHSTGQVMQDSHTFEKMAQMESTDPIDGVVNDRPCTTCRKGITDTYYHCLKRPVDNICESCFLEGRFPSNLTSVDFIKITAPAPIQSSNINELPWTSYELLYLLEGVELYNEDWEKIATHVKTKTPQECLAKFISYSCTTLADSDSPSSSKLSPNEAILAAIGTLIASINEDANLPITAQIYTFYEQACKDQGYSPDEDLSPTAEKSILEWLVGKILTNVTDKLGSKIVEQSTHESQMATVICDNYIKKLDKKLELIEALSHEIIDLEKKIISYTISPVDNPHTSDNLPSSDPVYVSL